MSNNMALPGIEPKGGDWLKAIDRGSAYSATVAAMGSKTRSQHPHVDKHYQYEDTEWGGALTQPSAYEVNTGKEPGGEY